MSNSSKKLIVLDLRAALKGQDQQGTPWAYDAAKAVGALQGIVNRKEPRLFITYLGNGLAQEAGKESQPGGQDKFWLDWLRQEGRLLADYEIIETSSLEDVFSRFIDEVEGVVLWDELVPSTANVASTLAGAEFLLPLRGVDDDNSFTAEIMRRFSTLSVKRDLRGKFTGAGKIPDTNLDSTGTAKCDAYVWAVENVMKPGLCSATHFAYYVDGVPWNKIAPDSLPYPDLGNGGVLNADYWITHKAFFFDLSPWDDEPATDDLSQPPGTDAQTLRVILRTANELNQNGKLLVCGGFVPWWVKYCRSEWGGREPNVTKHDAVPAEWRFVDILSAYNGLLDADAYGLTGLANASVYRHYPLKAKYEQKNKGQKDRSYDPKKTYVLFGMLDYDSAAWLAQAFPVNWQDPQRGKIPLWWGFNPLLSDRVPMVFDGVYESLTQNDTIGADECLGYINPNLLEGDRKFSDLPPAGELYLEKSRPYFERFSMSTTVFVITGDQYPVTERTLSILGQLSPDGVGFQGGDRVKDGLHCGVAFKEEEQDWFFRMKPEECVDSLEHFIKAKGPGGFVFYRCILFSPSQLVEAVEGLRSRCPELDFEVLDPITYFRFLKARSA